MSGVRFLIEGRRHKTAAVIHLKTDAGVWQDFYDALLARRRAPESRESLASVKRRLVPGRESSAAEYTVTFSRPARIELEKLPAQLVERIFPKIESLASQPRPAGCKKLQGGHNLWRIRVGDYRVVYTLDDACALVDIVATPGCFARGVTFT